MAIDRYGENFDETAFVEDHVDDEIHDPSRRTLAVGAIVAEVPGPVA